MVEWGPLLYAFAVVAVVGGVGYVDAERYGADDPFQRATWLAAGATTAFVLATLWTVLVIFYAPSLFVRVTGTPVDVLVYALGLGTAGSAAVALGHAARCRRS